MNNLNAIIFDLDGLMVDTEPISRSVWDRFLKLYGYTLDEDTYQRMLGRRNDVSAGILLEAFDLPLTVAEVIERKEAIYHRLRAKGVPAMAGLVELQAEIESRGMLWAVATASPRRHAAIILEQLQLLHKCPAIAAGDEVAYPKPAPDVYLLAAEKLGVSPRRCLALEDSMPGSQAAVAAGMRVIAIPNEQTRNGDFSYAYRRVDSLYDVLNNLDQLLAFGEAS